MNEQEAKYIITASAAQRIVDYLQMRPYGEVAVLIEIFKQLEMVAVVSDMTPPPANASAPSDNE